MTILNIPEAFTTYFLAKMIHTFCCCLLLVVHKKNNNDINNSNNNSNLLRCIMIPRIG